MTAKKKITDKDGVQVFPITHTKAVLDDNGNSVEQRLEEQMNVINQKQLEVGAVPSDLAPTKDSTYWVTSGGIYNKTYMVLSNILTDTAKVQSNGTINVDTEKWSVNQNYNGYWYQIGAFAGKTLVIKASSNGLCAVAFTTAISETNGQALSLATGNICENIAADSVKSYTVPSNAKYLYIMTNGNGTDRTPQYVNIEQCLVDAVSGIQISAGLKKDITSDIGISSGYFYNDKGIYKTSSNWSSSSLFSVKDIELLFVSSAVNDTMFQIVFFDKVGQLILNSSVEGSGDLTAASSNVAKIPSGAAFALVSGYTATSIPITVQAIFKEPAFVGEIEKEIDGLVDDKHPEAGNHGFYRENDYAWISSDNWRSTDIVSVEGFNYVKNVSEVNKNLYSIVFFSKDGQILSGIRGSGSSITSQTFEAAIPSNAAFVLMSGYTAGGASVDAVIGKTGAGSTVTPIDGLKRISLIVIYGQSLSVGADSTAITTSAKYSNALMFNTGVTSRQSASNMTSFVPLAESGVETPASGMAEMIVDAVQRENAFGAYRAEWNSHQFVFVCPGMGSATIDELTSSSDYQYVENAITAAKNICDANGYELDIPAWCWLQGEQDCKNSMSVSTYKSKLLALQDQFCSSVSTITGISARPKCIVYQPSCQNLYDPTAEYNYSYDHMGVPTAFAELLRDNTEFVAAVPTYIFDPATSGGVWIHLNAQSYKLLGGFCGYALKRLLIDGERSTGIVPLSVTVSGTTIKIKYSVPCPPLRFDTDYVNAAPNMGFNVIKSDNTELISSVSVFNDTITILCSSSPVGAKLRYGMNGTYHEFISGQYHYYSGAGRAIGARGNLRDNQGCYVYKNIQGVKYPMYNWAYTFEKLLEE